MAETRNDSLRTHLRDSGRISLRTILWLSKIMIPASALVFVLRRTGFLKHVAAALSGMIRFLELPGEAAIAVVTSLATNLYGVIATLPLLDLTLRQTTILALVTLVAHGFFVEPAITRTTGTPVLRMLLVRGGGGVILGRIMVAVLPRGGRWSEPLQNFQKTWCSSGAPRVISPFSPWHVLGPCIPYIISHKLRHVGDH